MQALTAAMMLQQKLGELWSSNRRDYEGSLWNFCNNWTKIGISQRISYQVLDRSSPYIQCFRHLYGDY